MKISIGCRNFKLGRDWTLCLLSALNAAPHVLATNLFNLLTIKQHWVSLLTLPFHSQTLVPLDTSLQAVVFQNAVFPLFSAVLIRAWSCLLRPYKEVRQYSFYLWGHKCQSLNKLTIKRMAGVLKSPKKYYLRLKLCLSDGCFYANPLYSRGSKTRH